MSWRRIGNVLDRPFPSDVHASGGIWAPTLRYHDGQFWLITKDVTGAGNFIRIAEHAAGPWSEPVPIDLPGIAPTSPGTTNSTATARSPACSRRASTRSAACCWRGPGRCVRAPAWPGEGPHLHRRNGWWYLLMSEGGTHTGHVVCVARSRSPRGPFEPAPANPILSHRSTDLAVQATGHGRYLSTGVATGFTGRVIGMYATRGTVRFDWFDYRSGP